MDVFITLIRIIAAVIAPLATLVFAALTLIRTQRSHGEPPQVGQKCVRCGESRRGGEAHFYYKEGLNIPNEGKLNKKIPPIDAPILGSENHFVCDRCAHGYIRNEIFQMILMALPYPIYLYVIPLFVENGIFTNFLIETFLIVLSLTGITAAFDLFRSVLSGHTPLEEARDRVAIKERKGQVRKQIRYFTRRGSTRLKKWPYYYQKRFTLKISGFLRLLKYLLIPTCYNKLCSVLERENRTQFFTK